MQRYRHVNQRQYDGEAETVKAYEAVEAWLRMTANEKTAATQDKESSDSEIGLRSDPAPAAALMPPGERRSTDRRVISAYNRLGRRYGKDRRSNADGQIRPEMEEAVAGLETVAKPLLEVPEQDSVPSAPPMETNTYTCGKCGAEMTYNVPRLGPNGGFVHKATGRLECSNAITAPNADAQRGRDSTSLSSQEDRGVSAAASAPLLTDEQIDARLQIVQERMTEHPDVYSGLLEDYKVALLQAKLANRRPR